MDNFQGKYAPILFKFLFSFANDFIYDTQKKIIIFKG